jgi:hypothetical protein
MKENNVYWGFDWLWGLPILMLTVVLHICGFVLMERVLVCKVNRPSQARSAFYRIAAIAVIALVAVTLHAFEAGVWALVYVSLEALPEFGAAMLYSLSAITAYGHSALFLEERWKLLGAIEAMNGLILFGLTTAFLFSAIELVRADRGR